jgi:hypothetical protein
MTRYRITTTVLGLVKGDVLTLDEVRARVTEWSTSSFHDADDVAYILAVRDRIGEAFDGELVTYYGERSWVAGGGELRITLGREAR